MDYQIEELKSWLNILKGQRNFLFTNIGIKQFWYVMNQYPDFAEMLEILTSDEDVFQAVNKSFGQNSPHNHIIPFFKENQDPHKYYSLCACVMKYIGECSQSKGNLVYSSTLDAINSEDQKNDFEPAKLFFINGYIAPLVDYLIRHRVLTDQRVNLLKRYRLLCTKFDRERLLDVEEVVLTKEHMSRFLFDQGIDNVLWETNVPKGRIDVFNESNSIVIEGKIFKGDNLFDQKQAISQAFSRLEFFKFGSAFVVIYNKSKKGIEIDQCDGYTLDEPYWNLGGKKIYIIVINLDSEITKIRDDWANSIEIVKLSKNDYLKSKSSE